MRDGIYEASFTTDQGMFGTGAVLIRNNRAYGADNLQFYRGEIAQDGDDLRVVMEVSRHDFAALSAFGDATVFTLNWAGKSLADSGFRMSCRPEGVAVTVHVTGRLLLAHG